MNYKMLKSICSSFAHALYGCGITLAVLNYITGIVDYGGIALLAIVLGAILNDVSRGISTEGDTDDTDTD